MVRLELLSPVGDFDSLIAAVSNGADAIYLGSKLFNARRLAHNFTGDDLKKAVQYAHLHNVKVYLTLNTLVKNHEIAPFLNQLSIAEQLGIDAVILQDLTFAPLIKTHFPKLSIHASTQATVMNSPAVEFWKKYVDVFVLARELTKLQVHRIWENTGAHLETFVHGHLCISYSGQCLISSLIGKRSGNRGMCASSCRKQYNGNHYLISAKDLCMIRNLKDVIESGVKTIKIEGRMKSAEYVATTTRYYREQIDSYYAKHKTPVTEGTIQDLKMVFNREFTPGFFNNETSIVDSTIPSKRGILLGKVVSGQLLLQHDLEKYDGINIVYQGKKQGCHVKNIYHENVDVPKAGKGEKIKLTVPGFRNGAFVYLTSPLHGKNLLGEKKRITISLNVNIVQDETPLFSIECRGNIISIPLKVKAASPQKHPFTWEMLEKELRKWDSDIFVIDKMTGTTDNSFIPKSALTIFRAQLDQVLLDALVPISSLKKKGAMPIYPQHHAGAKKILVQVYSLQGVHEALQAGADVIYYDAFALDVEQVSSLIKNAENAGKQVQFFLSTPMVLVDEDFSKLNTIIARIKPDGILANNVGILGMNLKLPLVLGYQMNIFNDNQLQFYGYPVIASIELTAQELSQFQNKRDLIYYAHGRPVVMTFKEDVPASALTDKEGYTFPLRKTKTGSTEMLYSRHLGILQRTNEISHAGITQLFLDLDENVFTLTDTYRRLLRGEYVDVSAFKKDATMGNVVKGVM